MSEQRDPEGPRAISWAEHTVVANLPRLLPRPSAAHEALAATAEPRTLIGIAPPPSSAEEVQHAAAAVIATAPDHHAGRDLSVADEPRTVVGQMSRAAAQRLLTRYTALASVGASRGEEEVAPEPARHVWLRRVATFARDDFRRAPRVVRLLLPALPLVAAATTFLDVDPTSPALSPPVAVAATSTQAPSAPLSQLLPAVPAVSASLVPRPGRTLAAEAADAAARGDRHRALAIYAQLARERPDVPAYASAARILTRDVTRNRPGESP
jgi:hypothetical protein